MCNENDPTKASEPVTWAKIDQLICAAIRSDLAPDVQRELGKLVNLIKPIKDLELKDQALKINANENKDQPVDSETPSGSGVRRNSNNKKHRKAEGKARIQAEKFPFNLEYYLSFIQYAIVTLTCAKPNLTLAKEIRRELEDHAFQRGKNAKRLYGAPPMVKVLIGLGAAILVLTVIFVVFLYCFDKGRDILYFKRTDIFVVFIFGALGSILSIMFRAKDFNDQIDDRSSYLLFTGGLRPFIGMGFALFVYALVESKIVPIQVDEKKPQALFAALAFICGFSERFATGLLHHAEGKFSGDRSKKESPGVDAAS